MNRNAKFGRVRVVERAGPKLRNILCNSTPWKSEWCGRQDCPPCTTKPGSCRASNVVYQIQCQDCLGMGKTTNYFGESGRAWWDRAREHAQALTSKNQNYAIVKHWLKEHPTLEEPPKYSYKLLGTFKSAIHRQITEAIMIDSQDQTTIINGKGEWGTNKVPRYKLTLEDEILRTTDDPIPATKCHEPGKRKDELVYTCDFSTQYSQRIKRIRLAKKDSKLSTERRAKADPATNELVHQYPTHSDQN